MSDMKCPFCQQKLVRHWGMEEPALYCCDNPKCSRGGVATESSWQELIRTCKALEIAVDALKWIQETYNLGMGYEAAIMEKCEFALEQMTALEQKDVK